jgi:hypothetical protein
MKWSSAWNSSYSLAVFTAILGFIFAVIAQRIQNRRTPRKAISWDADIARPAQLEKGRDRRIGISYNGIPVEDLFQAKIHIENTGNTLVRNQYIRFRMPAGAKLLELEPNPAPEPELDVRDVSEEASRGLIPAQRRYRIGHFEAGQKVSFLIVTDGGAWAGWDDIHPFNDEGGVDFQPRDIARAKEDAEEVQPFIRNLAAFLLLTILASISPTPESWAFSGLALIPCVYVFISAPRIMRVIRQLIGNRPRDSWTVHVTDSQGLQVGGENSQVNRWTDAAQPTA